MAAATDGAFEIDPRGFLAEADEVPDAADEVPSGPAAEATDGSVTTRPVP